MRTIGRSVSSFLSAMLTIASIGLALAFATSVILLAVSPWADFGGHGTLGIPVALDIDSQALHVSARDLPDGSARLTKVTGILQFTAPSKRALVVPLLTLSVMLLIAVWVVQQLRALLRALSAGREFDPRNVRHVQRIGWAVIAAEPLRAWITYSANTYAASHFVADGMRFVWNVDLNLSVVFCGLVILLIAEVFRAGTKLDEDQSLTI
jgi:hypothetical protein